jgi:hypothetical protein
MATNTVVGASVLKLLKEEMAGMARHVIEETDDPVTRGIALNSSSVTRTLGRSPGGATTSAAGDSAFETIHPLTFGRAGALKYGDMGGAATTGGEVTVGPPPRLKKNITYPSATIAPQRNTEWLKIPLKWMQGNLTIHRHQLLALQSGSPVEDFLADWLRDPIEIIHQQSTNDFFGNAGGQIGVNSAAASAAMSSAGDSAVLTLSSRARPLWRGQIFTICDGAAGDPSTGSGSTIDQSSGGPQTRFMITQVFSFTGTLGETKCKVEALDDLDGSITIASGDTMHLWGANDVTSGTELVYGVQGLGNFLLDQTAAGGTNIAIHGLTVRDTLNVDYYPELFSYIDSPSTDRWPTPSVFEKAMDEISDRGFSAPDRWIVGRGVRTLFYMAEGQYKTYQVGLDSPVQRGADGGITGQAAITTEKGVAEMVVSAYGDRDVAYGVRPDAFVHYAPDGVDAIDFVGDSPLLGNSMFLVARSSDDVTPIYEAPFDFYFERGCLAPQTLAKIGGLTYHSEVSA